jgi:hypothetical protein
MLAQEPLWEPLKRAFRAAVALLGHLCLGAFVALCIWALGKFLDYLWHGSEPMFYHRIPIRWMFDTADLGIMGVFVIFGAYEAFRKLSGD